MIKSLLDYVVCPICLTSLELEITKLDEDDVIEGKLKCNKCQHNYMIHGGIPILAPPSIKPSDGFHRDLIQALKQYSPKEALQKIIDGEIGTKRLASNEPFLTPEEIKQGEYRGSEKFLQDQFGSIEEAREHFRRSHEKNRKFFDSMIEMGRLDKADLILDIGTGSGYMLQYIAQKFNSAKIFSIDVFYPLLIYVRRRLNSFGIKNVNLILADANKPPFPDNMFDSIDFYLGKDDIAGFSFIIAQAYRILRNDGWFVTDYQNQRQMLANLMLYITRKYGKPLINVFGTDFDKYFKNLGFLLTKAEVIEYMNKIGFKKILDKKLDRAHIISGRK